jgi:hypothetical protein
MSAPTIAVPGSVQRDTEPQSQTQVQQQDIANLAYALWQQRGSPQGSSEQDWIKAEQKLQSERSGLLTGR